MEFMSPAALPCLVVGFVAVAAAVQAVSHPDGKAIREAAPENGFRRIRPAPEPVRLGKGPSRRERLKAAEEQRMLPERMY